MLLLHLKESGMACNSSGSLKREQFRSEINIHFPELKDVNSIIQILDFSRKGEFSTGTGIYQDQPELGSSTTLQKCLKSIIAPAETRAQDVS